MSDSTRFFKLVHDELEVGVMRFEYSLFDIEYDIVYSAHDYSIIESLISEFDYAYDSYVVYDDEGTTIRSKNI